MPSEWWGLLGFKNSFSAADGFQTLAKDLPAGKGGGVTLGSEGFGVDFVFFRQIPHAVVAFIQQELFTFLPQFTVFVGGAEVARVKREFTFFRPRYTVEGLDWDVDGSFWEHDYQITANGRPIVTITKEWMTWGDTYELDIADPADEIVALAVVLTIDCVQEMQNNNH